MLVHTHPHTATPTSLSMHWQTLLPPNPHRDKSSLLQHLKPGLILTGWLPSRFSSWSLLCLQQSYYRTFTKCLYLHCKENRWHTSTHRLETINTIYSISFYSFLCLEIAGSIFFINHITWHDAPKFTLSVYRNTLNKTQGFTMDTRLTFCPMHLQQWMIISRFFVSFFSFFLYLSSPCRSYPSNSRPDRLIRHSTLWVPQRIFSSCFTIHSTYRNPT